MSRLECCYTCLRESADKSHISYKIKKFVSSALIREMKFEVAEITMLCNRKLRLTKKLTHVVNLFFSHRMLHNHDGIIHISTLDKSFGCEEFQLMEEAESTATCKLTCIIIAFGPLRCLHPKHSGVKIHGNLIRRLVCRLDSHPRTALLIFELDSLRYLDINSLRSLLLKTISCNCFGVILGASVENRHFLIINLD